MFGYMYSGVVMCLAIPLECSQRNIYCDGYILTMGYLNYGSATFSTTNTGAYYSCLLDTEVASVASTVA